jgi:hypothetical protein
MLRTPPLLAVKRLIREVDDMGILTKVCRRCKQEKPVTEFYTRSGISNPTAAGHYLTECKSCLRERNKHCTRLSKLEPRAFTETIAVNYFRSCGVPVLPGKAVYAADVDLAAWGHVWIEVKYSKLRTEGLFYFNATVKQQQRGFLAHLVLLICEYPDNQRTFHLFRANDPVFVMKGRLKTATTFRPGSLHPLKHGNNRVVMTQTMMDAAQDRLELIEEVRKEISADLIGEC